MKKTLFPAVMTVLMTPATVFAQDITLSVQGLEGALKKNAEAYLAAIPSNEHSVSLRFQGRLQKSLNQSLNALGYYHAKFHFQVEDSGQRLVIQITPGPPTRIKQLDIKISGEAQHDADFKRLLESSGLKVGEVLNQGQYDALKSAIRNLALQKGYFDGKFIQAQLEVSPANNQASIHLHYASGTRSQFGATTITGSQIQFSRVKSLQPYQKGDPYLASDITKLYRNLAATDWFSSVVVTPDLSQSQADNEIPIKVVLAPETKNKLETGLGYSTDVGVRGTLKWNKPWVNDKGDSFTSSFSLSKPEQEVTFGYRMPLANVWRDYYLLQYGMKKVDNLDTDSLESNLSFGRHWTLDNGWHRTLRIRYLVENYQQGLQDDVGQFVMPGIAFSRTRSRGGAMPTWADSQSLSLEYGDSALASETRVLRVQGGSSWIRSLGQNQRGLFRLDAGANITEQFDKLSPSLRFFAGGDNSIRGYSYDSISPTDDSGALTGGKYLLTTSLEYQHRIVGNWWGALFYDYGDAFTDSPDFKRGTGFGLRWASPVGPVRLDFAWGLDAPSGTAFRLHFSLGPEL